MAEKKKKQTAEFAKDKNAFASGVPAKKNSVENKEKQKQSGAHQPRDADTTSGHNRAVDKPLAKKICIYENICVDESLR